MNRLFKIEAKLKLNKQGGRTLPIKTGYRPGFFLSERKQISVSIDLLGIEYLNPGEEAIVEMCFMSNELLGDFGTGSEFKICEGPVEIGHGKFLKIIGWV